MLLYLMRRIPGKHMMVIQKHDAVSLHFDARPRHIIGELLIRRKTHENRFARPKMDTSANARIAFHTGEGSSTTATKYPGSTRVRVNTPPPPGVYVVNSVSDAR